MTESRLPFTPAVLMYAPACAGVYMLWDRDGLIFVGHARAPGTILDRLMDHYCGRARPSQATHCSWRLTGIDSLLELAKVGASAEPALAAYEED
jgi:hypothetical protein